MTDSALLQQIATSLGIVIDTLHVISTRLAALEEAVQIPPDEVDATTLNTEEVRAQTDRQIDAMNRLADALLANMLATVDDDTDTAIEVVPVARAIARA